jgi:hypothetical protein
MVNDTFTRRHVGTVAALAGAFGLAVVLAPPAAAIHIEQYLTAQCQPATGQSCPQNLEVTFQAGQNERLQAQFMADANACSDALIRFNVDKYPQGDWVRVSPNQTVSSPTFTRSGDHVLSVTAQGIEGGCNTGILSSWGGTVRIDSVDEVGPAPHTVAAPTPAPCTWTHSGGVVIQQDNGIRVDLDQWNGLTAMGPAHLYAPGATVESNRGEVIGAGGDGTTVSFTIVWYDKQGRHAETNDYTGSIDPQWGTLGGTTTNNAGVTNQWSANEHWTCGR